MDTKQRVEIPALIRGLLRKRGLDDAAIESFLHPDYDTGLADPFLMNGMNNAITRITQAIETNEHVAVYGDYDIDGISSTALMVDVLTQHGLDVTTYIPDRYDEGYGIHIAALQKLQQQGVGLVISVDCGITSVAEATWAREHGLDLIITDHHDVPPTVPNAIAVINPKQVDDEYPFKELAGVGVAFAVARALQQRTGIPAHGQEKWLLDLVALGTVCDVMPLVHENRTIVFYGLKVLQKTRRVGLVALAQSAGVDLGEIRAYHLGFVLGPRLNASGRLEHASYSLELMMTADPIEAQAFAFQLEEMNHQRRLQQDRIFAEADAMAETYQNDSVLVLSDSNWAHGIVGIVASKIAEKWEKPTLLLQQLGESAKGSARSSGGYNLIEGLRANSELFDRLGGHHFAAGFTLPADRINDLRAHMNAHYAEVASSLPERTQREADIIAEEPDDISWDIYNSLSLLEPFGSENPEPAFGLSHLKIMDIQMVGKTRSHLKLRMAAEDGTIFDAIGFNLCSKYPDLKSGQTINVLCYLSKNEWNERISLQLSLIAIH